MRSNSSTVVSWLCAVIVAVNCCPRVTGCVPSEPTETVVFCACTALTTSAGVSAYSTSFNGSSQIRIA